MYSKDEVVTVASVSSASNKQNTHATLRDLHRSTGDGTSPSRTPAGVTPPDSGRQAGAAPLLTAGRGRGAAGPPSATSLRSHSGSGASGGSGGGVVVGESGDYPGVAKKADSNISLAATGGLSGKMSLEQGPPKPQNHPSSSSADTEKPSPLRPTGEREAGKAAIATSIHNVSSFEGANVEAGGPPAAPTPTGTTAPAATTTTANATTAATANATTAANANATTTANANAATGAADKNDSTADAAAVASFGEKSALLSGATRQDPNQAPPPRNPDDPDSIPDDAPELHALPAGAVGRRAPANPFNSPLVTKIMGGKKKVHPKIKDPKLLNNPLRGRLLVCISTTALLFWIFFWELLYNYTSYNGRCVSPVYYPSYKEASEDKRQPFVIRYGYGACDHNLGNLARPRATLGHRACDKGWPKDLVPNGDAGSSNAEWDSPNPRIFRALGGLETNYIRNYGEIFRLFTSMYLHGGWLHILINISCQIQMFWIIEPDWGFIRTTLLFFLGGLTGSLLSAVADPCNITVGSSGAMYALLAALIPYCVEYWKSIPRPVCILIFMIVVLIVGIVTGLSGFTDNYAHIGGIVGGILWGFATITTVSACDKCTLGERMATTPPFSWCVPKTTQQKLLERARQRKALAMRRRKIQAARKKKAGGARGKAMYAVKMRLQEEGRPPCKMSFREWFVRGVAAAALITFWIVMFLYLLDSTLYTKYPPPGQLKFEGWLFCKCGTIVYEAKQTIGNLGKFWCFSTQNDVDFYLKK